MGSEQEGTPAIPAPTVNRSLPGFYFEEKAAEPAYRNTETAVPVFLYDEVDTSAATSRLPKIRSFAAFESAARRVAALRQSSFRSAVKGYFENGGSACYVAALSTGSEIDAKIAIRDIINFYKDCTLICYPQEVPEFSLKVIAEVAELDDAIANANNAFAEAALNAAEAVEAAVKADVRKSGSSLNEQQSKQAIDAAVAAERVADAAWHKAMDDALKAVGQRDTALAKHNLRMVYLLNMKASDANVRKYSARKVLQAATQAVAAAREKEKLTALDQLAATTRALRASNDQRVKDKKLRAEKEKLKTLEEHMKELVEKKVRWSKIWAETLLASKYSGRTFALIDLPVDSSLAKSLLEFLNNEADKSTLGYGAAYWPPVHDEAGNVVLPCGMIAGAIQKTDGDRGIWKAPANVTLANAYNTTADVMQNTSLFEGDGALGVNAIRVFSGRGVKVWGCRTLIEKQNDNRSFVQSSRMLSYIENNLHRLSRFAVFEPSNEITWVKLHNIIYAWLHALWLKGGLAGATENEAFSVLVGKDESMTDADIDNGALRVNVAFALQQPLQFIHLQIRMIGGELTVTDQSNGGGASK